MGSQEIRICIKLSKENDVWWSDIIQQKSKFSKQKTTPTHNGYVKKWKKWIADTEASNHVSFSAKGHKNKKNNSISHAKIIGETTESKIQMDIPGTFCDK